MTIACKEVVHSQCQFLKYTSISTSIASSNLAIMMKALWLFGLSIGLGQALNVDVNVKVGQGSGAPVWEFPDWEGYPCHLEGQSGCPGYVKTGTVWGES